MDVPAQIGRYRVDRLLGKGSMGCVYLGHDPQLDRRVAIKTLRDLNLDETARDHFLQRFENEARAAARLHHPNIVQIYDVAEDSAVGPYLVFEYIEGLSLRQHLHEHGPLDTPALIDLTRQISRALEIAHAAGVIHRDIKPDNLLLAQNGRICLADFGIARLPNAALTGDNQFLGTPCYAAPETLRGGDWSPRSDIFSLGASIYEAATGKRAFPGNQAMRVAQKVLNDDPDPPSKVRRTLSGAVDKVILKALAKNPKERFGSAAEFSDALSAACETSTTSLGRRLLGGMAFAAISLAVAFWLWNEGQALPQPGTNLPGLPIPDASPAQPDAAIADAAPTESDGAVEALTAHDREEEAKDELAKARQAIAEGDLDSARTALARAHQLDPTNPDIDELRAQLEAAP